MATNSRRYWVSGNRPLRETSYSWGTGLRDGVRLGILVRIELGQPFVQKEGNKQQKNKHTNKRIKNMYYVV
jgi:hypothetical protein